MKAICTVFLLMWSTGLLQAQEISISRPIPVPEENPPQPQEINNQQPADTTGRLPLLLPFPDTSADARSALPSAEPGYNQRQPVWKPAAQVAGINALFMGFNRYVAKADYGYVRFSTWKRNLRAGGEWDSDKFGINFIGHPYQGTLYYNAARSQGYTYWQSLPFAVAGSLTWEYFGENTLPSYNDMIYTPLNGAALGEILYRLSSKILDDRSRGRERAIRELSAGILNPVRGLNRLLQGKSFQVSSQEEVQQEPLNITLFAGMHRLNEQENDVFGKGGNKAMVNIQLDYGDPFKNRHHRPFDFFRLRTEFSRGADTIGGTINNVTGYGILLGRHRQLGRLSLLAGAFQYYDYWDTRDFELGALGLGGGVFAKLPLSNEINLYTNAHLGLIPLAGNSSRFVPDSLGLRDYVFANGLQAKIESTLSLGRYASAAFVYYHFWLHTFQGLRGSNSIGIVRPRVTVRLFKNLSLGYEHFGYATNRWLRDYPNQHSVITEQKIFLQLYLQDPQRQGRYN